MKNIIEMSCSFQKIYLQVNYAQNYSNENYTIIKLPTDEDIIKSVIDIDNHLNSCASGSILNMLP